MGSLAALRPRFQGGLLMHAIITAGVWAVRLNPSDRLSRVIHVDLKPAVRDTELQSEFYRCRSRQRSPTSAEQGADRHDTHGGSSGLGSLREPVEGPATLSSALRIDPESGQLHPILPRIGPSSPADVHPFEILPVVLNHRLDKGAAVSALQSH
jgi:hypothetical protein